jgi:HD-GYP domain-containing protein (c-di-GMP phosphodiesterase class II)
VVLHLGGLKERIPFYNVRLDSDPEKELLSIPLHQGEMLVGFVNLVRTKNTDRVGDSEIQTLSVLSSQASASLENKKLFLELESAYLSSIKALAKTLEFKDEYTHGHAERVARLCMKIGKYMNMDEKSLKVLHNAALLHDIGKIGSWRASSIKI